MTGFILKTIAFIAMLTDHIAYSLVDESLLYTSMRLIGRLAFPIFAFMVAEGCKKTHNLKKYFLRLLLFALISEPFFDYAVRKGWKSQNTFFTLALGVLDIYMYEQVKKLNNTRLSDLALLGVILFSVLCNYLNTDYGTYGILTIFFIYLMVDRKKQLLVLAGMLSIIYISGNDLVSTDWSKLIFALYSLPLLAFYNGKRGPNIKWAFYIAYPLHFLILGLIKYFIKGA